jgi:hypothetical protein
MVKPLRIADGGLRLRGLALLLLLASGAGSGAAQDTARAAPAARAEDVASIDAILGVLYDVISGPAGQARDWDRFRSLFAPGARLIPTRQRPNGPAEAVVMDPDGYVERVGPFFAQNGFFEKELARKTERFGRIAHAFSSYASFRAAIDTVPFSRGINSIQLLHDGARWWIVTIYWDAERPGLTLPEEYLRR